MLEAFHLWIWAGVRNKSFKKERVRQLDLLLRKASNVQDFSYCQKIKGPMKDNEFLLQSGAVLAQHTDAYSTSLSKNYKNEH